MTLNIVTTSGKNTTLEVNQGVFGAKPNTQLLAQAVYVYQSNQRQGSSKVKTRGEVNRTKKKWYKQKGTGGARHGARSPNIFVGGGVAHGPTGMQNWSRDLSKGQRRKALIYALSLKAQEKSVMVSEELEKLSAKTKQTAAFLEKVTGGEKRVLVVLHESIDNVLRSTRNIANVLVTQASRLNVYELMLADKVLFTKDAIKKVEDRLMGEQAVNPAKTEKGKAKVVAKPAIKPAAKPNVKKVVKPAVTKTAKPAAKSAVKKAVAKAPAKKTTVKKAK